MISRGQLIAAGISRQTIGRWLAKGLLHPEFRGVYRFGHRAPSFEARYMAAVLAAGPRAALGGEAAAFAFGLLRGRPPAPEVVSLADRRVSGVVVHRVRELARADLTVWRGIRTTTVERTLVDLAATLDLDALAVACHEANVRFRTGARHVAAVLARRPRAHGVANLRAIFHGDAPVMLSRLERAFVKLLRAERLPVPHMNRRAGQGYIDCHFPQHGVTIELDSYRYHHTRHAWERDRRKEREARARGEEFRRLTWGDVMEDRALVAAELHALLSSETSS